MIGPALHTDMLPLACTRPAMKWGVPMQGYFGNVFFTALFAFIVGQGNPAFYLLFFVFHIPMVALANRNPNFFHEIAMWAETRGRTIGGVLYAVGGRGVPSSA